MFSEKRQEIDFLEKNEVKKIFDTEKEKFEPEKILTEN
jgi:hypothetical protein